MKNQLIKNLWMPVVGLLLFAISCKKQDLVPEENETTTQERISGVVPDDPELVSKVPLIISRDYLARKATAKGPGKGKGGSTGTTTDQTAPSVSITSPTQSASVSGTVSIAVSASDNVGVSSVAVTINGAALGTDITAPYAFSWNADASPDGVYTIEATAKDAVGNWSKTTISVTKNTTVVVDPPPTSTSGVSLTMPPVQNQGGEGSCVAFAVGYAARSAEQYYRTGAASYSYGANVFSPEYLYNQTKASSDCSSGSSVTVALNFLISNGIATWQSMPYSSSNGCSLLPSSSQTSEATNFKISAYSRLNSSDVSLIKSMIQQKHPVIVTVIADNSFVNAKAGFVWKTYSGSGSLAHCIAIVGFDDAKNAWKVMNSWGTGWGDAGYSYIDYNFLPTVSGYAYVIN